MDPRLSRTLAEPRLSRAIDSRRVADNARMSSPSFQVTLLPANERFDARADESLLKAGLRALVPMRSSCRNGTCRTCMCRLVAGEIAYEIEWPGLLAEEKREGWILPCVARPLSDVVLRDET
jgi:ferredoxin